MRSIVHISDLHFGRVDPAIIQPLIATIGEIKPDLVAVSGDLTQRARSDQFLEARAFLDGLPQPQIVVPGNHDVPLHNVFSRFLNPLEKYRRYISNDLMPFYADDEMLVIGVNTARSLSIKGGRINEKQLEWMSTKLCAYGEHKVRVVVTHHPFDLPEGFKDRHLVGRSRMAMEGLASCGVDLFLAGHLHVSHSTHTATRYKIKGHSALVVQAGTASSTRSRGEANSFNVIRLEHPHIAVERLVWQTENAAFTLAATEHFNHTTDGWMRA